MKSVAYISVIVFVAIAATSCEPAKQGGYNPPSSHNDGQFDDVVVQIDSSVEKAIAHDTTKRVYKL